MTHSEFKAYMAARKALTVTDYGDEEYYREAQYSRAPWYGIDPNRKRNEETKLLGPALPADELNPCLHWKITSCRSRIPNCKEEWCSSCLKLEADEKQGKSKTAADKFFDQLDQYAATHQQLNSDVPPPVKEEGTVLVEDGDDVNEMTISEYTVYLLEKVAGFLRYISDPSTCYMLQNEDRGEAYGKWQDIQGLLKQIRQKEDDEYEDDDDEPVVDLDLSKFDVEEVEVDGVIPAREQEILDRVLEQYEMRRAN